MEHFTSQIQYMAPRLTGEPYNQAEAMGSALWLWMHSEFHRNFPLHALNGLLLPAIGKGQFILVTENKKPVFYLSWALFSEEAEARYLSRSLIEIQPQDWDSGDRMWLLDWISPFGHTLQMRRLTERLLHNRYCRWAPRKGNSVVREYRGISVLKEEARFWFLNNPALTPAYVAARQTGFRNN